MSSVSSLEDMLPHFDDDSYSDEDEEYRREEEAYLQAQKDWEESVQSLQMLVSVFLLPYIGKWLGRKWAHWLHLRYVTVGFGRTFFLGGRTL